MSSSKKSNEEIQVGTDVSRLVGRTIIGAHREPPSTTDKWEMWAETLSLTLDDGSVWRFVGDGYDASGLDIYITENCGTEGE